MHAPDANHVRGGDRVTDVREAVVQGSVSRFVPILMTALSIGLALVQVAFDLLGEYAPSNHMIPSPLNRPPGHEFDLRGASTSGCIVTAISHCSSTFIDNQTTVASNSYTIGSSGYRAYMTEH